MPRVVRNALFVLPTDVIGGAEKVAKNLVKFLLEESVFDSIEVYFLCKGRSGGWEELEGLSGLRLSYNDYKDEKRSILPFLVHCLINRSTYSFIYTTHLHINAYISMLAKIRVISSAFLVARESTVITERFSGAKLQLLKLLYKFYGAHDLLICQTSYMYESLISSKQGCLARNIAVLPNPVSPAGLGISESSDGSYSKQFGQNFIALMVGRLVPVKNHKVMLKAISMIDRPLLSKSGFVLEVVGDGELMSQLKDQAKSLGIGSFVDFIGHISEPQLRMKTANMGVVTSLKEGFPNVLLEMMISGTQYIATTPCAGDLDMLDDVKVLDGFSSIELAAEISKALENRFDFSDSYIKQARARGVESYWDKIESFRFNRGES